MMYVRYSIVGYNIVREEEFFNNLHCKFLAIFLQNCTVLYIAHHTPISGISLYVQGEIIFEDVLLTALWKMRRMEKFRIPAKTQHLYGKRETWVHSARPVHRERTKVYVPFRAPGARKNGRNGPFRAIDGKNRINTCNGTEISVVSPLGIFRIDS